MDMSQVKKADFKLEDIFEIKNGVRLKSEHQKPGKTPFISARSGNNGISSFISNTNDSLDSHVLGVNYNGNVLEVYYHPYKALFSDDVKRFKVTNFEANERMYLYLATQIKKLKQKFSYTEKFNSKAISKSTISLPVTNDGKPDWELMEEYIKYIQNKQLEQIKKKNAHEAALLEKLYGDQTPTEPAPVDKAEFKVGDIFEMIRKTETEAGHSTRHKLTEKFSLPGITGATTNNGIGCFVDPNEHDAIDNVITVAPHSGAVFYHPYKIAISKNVYALKPKNNSKAVCSYLAAILNAMNKGKFDYSNLASWGRYKDLTITLPINNQGNPNWEWMEAYIAWIQYRERESVESYVAQEEAILEKLITS